MTPDGPISVEVIALGSVATGFAYLLAGVAVGVLSIGLTLNYRGVMTRVEAAGLEFGARLPWIGRTDPRGPGLLARFRPVMLSPLYLISLLLVASAVIEFTR